MSNSLICLTLTGKTLEEDVALVYKYLKYIDIVELRVDHLNEEEQLQVRKFPSMINVPCILTIRRVSDGGNYSGSEFSRTALFGRALAFADQNPLKNFAYVDFEEDFNIPSLQDAAQAFGVKIIRSFHDFNGPVKNLRERLESMRKTGYEIPKIAFMPKNLNDITELFTEASKINDFDHILCAMSNLGFPSRVLASKLNSYLTYVSPIETMDKVSGIGHLDPVTINELYNFRKIDENTNFYAVTGFPLKVTSSPKIHNQGYKNNNLNNLFIPLASTSIKESLDFAQMLNIKGMAVTVPYKEDLLSYLDECDEDVREIGACNTVCFEDGKLIGHNTDAYGFTKALQDFLGVQKLHRRKVAIIGAGGAAKAIAYAIKKMGGRACIFNRTLSTAKNLAEKFGFAYAQLGEDTVDILDRYSDIIIQTTNVGMHSTAVSSKENNPIYYYTFRGNEYLMDIIYDPEITPIMSVAKQAGCKVANGYAMLLHQGYKQFKYFTGVDYECDKSE